MIGDQSVLLEGKFWLQISIVGGLATLIAACGGKAAIESSSSTEPAPTEVTVTSVMTQPTVSSSSTVSSEEEEPPPSANLVTTPGWHLTDTVTFAGTPIKLLLYTDDSFWQASKGLLSVYDPTTGEVTDEFPNDASLAEPITADGSVWILNNRANSMSVIDIEARVLTETIDVGRKPRGLLEANGSIWVINNWDGTLSVIDIATRQVTDTIVIDPGPRYMYEVGETIWISTGGDPLRTRDSITIVDTETHEVDNILVVAPALYDVFEAEDSVWLLHNDNITTTIRIHELGTGKLVDKIVLPAGSIKMHEINGFIWTTHLDHGTISIIDPATRKIVNTITLAPSAGLILEFDGAIWVTSDRGTVLNIFDPETLQVTESIDIPQTFRLREFDGDIWLVHNETISRLERTDQ